MPAVVQFICQRCGEVTHALVAGRPGAITTCDQCGGIRQAVRIFNDRRTREVRPVVERRRDPA